MTTGQGGPFQRVVYYLKVERKPLVIGEWLVPLILAAQGASWLGGNNPFATSKNYAIMASLASENAWGAFFLVIGVITFALQIPRRDGMRRAALIVSSAIYLFVGISFFVSLPLTTLAWPFVGVGLLALALFAEIR